MNFSSHVDIIVTASVRLVNALTPGEAHGRRYPAPVDDELAGAATQALEPYRAGGRDLTFGEAVELREAALALREVFGFVAAGDLDAAADLVNAMLASTGARPMLNRHDGEPWHLHFHGAEESLANGWAAGCVTGLAVVLGSDLGGRLGICTADRCDRVYVDTSKNGTRRFCSTACQNRVKAAAFRARQAYDGTEPVRSSRAAHPQSR